MKRLITILLVLIMTFSLSSCVFIEQLSWDKSKQYAVDPVDLDDNGHNDVLIYKNTYYYLDPRIYLNGSTEDLEIISWNGLRFVIFYVHFYYSNTENNPDWIYNFTISHGTYLREGYDYKDKNFLLEGLDITFNYGDLFDENGQTDVVEYDIYSDQRYINLVFEEHPELYLIMDLYCENGEWYGMFNIESNTYEKIKLSNELVAILLEKGLIE